MAKSKAPPPDPSPEDGFDFEEDLEELEAAFEEHFGALQTAAAETFERLSEAAAQLAEQARHVYDTSQDYVRRHPGAPLLGALALGVVLGVLLGRR